MKTTLDIDDRVLQAAKRRAAASGKSLKAYVEDALRAQMLPRVHRHERYRLVLPTVKGTHAPAVDVADRRALLDFFDENP